MTKISDNETSDELIHQILALLDKEGVGFEITDPKNNGKYLYVNETAAKQSGLTKDQMLTLSVPEVNPEWSAEKYNALMQDLLRSEHRNFQIKTAHQLTPSDPKTSLLINGYLETDSDDQPKHLLALTQDISELTEAQHLLAEQKEKLEETVIKRTAEVHELLQIKEQFIANLSHEIRTPLHAILAMAQSLENELIDLKTKAKTTLIKKSSESLLHLLDSLLDASKLGANKLVLNPKEIHLRSTLQSIFDEDAILAQKKNLILTINNNVSSDLYAKADESRVRQILKNIFGNAVKFTERGSIDISLNATINHKDGNPYVLLEISITDTGIGMEAQFLNHIFGRFSQADSSISRNQEGSGLGLSISKELAKLMNGTITVSSTLNKGSTFNVILKLPLTTKTQAMKINGHALIVDDIEVNRLVAYELTCQLGMEATKIASGMEAIELAQKETFDVILMDIQMPIVDGIQASKLIRDLESLNSKPRTPIIAVTAHNTDKDKEECFSVGMDYYLPKPFNLNDLYKAFVACGLSEK